ncbi:MAG: hypothetical protein KU38_02760 [Sulfurovum sp. FS08-3]|nr:MAG: hypothetical protein KU38_02760 [Sulfurovum sp. FS08-3]
MRKIDKSTILSQNYKHSVQKFKKDEHEPYESKYKRDYYTDMKMSLLYCQKGLCAYTEQMLCEPIFIAENNWDNEKYKNLERLEKDKIQGDIDHFNKSLKSKNAFLWDNLFVVATHVNCRIKGRQEIIEGILKPDSNDYDPYKCLSWIKDDTNKDMDIYIFSPNKNLSIDKQKKIQKMIDILGLNCIDSLRQRQLNEWSDRYEMGFEVKPHQYITAWNMTLTQLQVANKQ